MRRTTTATALTIAMLTSSLCAQQFAPAAGRPATEIPPGPRTFLALADCDGDGDQDVATDNVQGQFGVLRQGPGATWTTETILPNVVTAAAWTDFDRDGDLDLLVGATGTSTPVPVGIARNDGPTFTWLGQGPSALLGTVRTCLARDLDGDQLPDVVLGVSSGVQVHRNLGNNTIGAPWTLPRSGGATPALFDRDGDGDLDLVVADGQLAQLFDNTNGTFTPAGTVPTSASAVLAADFDSDGRTDLCFGEQLFLNQPTGWQLTVLPLGPGWSRVLAGDLDRDGDPDLVVGQPDRIDWLRNDGAANFTTLLGMRLPALSGANPIACWALGDGAARGAADVVVVGNGSGAVRTLYGAAPSPFEDPQATDLVLQGEPAVGDVDGDGRADLVQPTGEVRLATARGAFARRPIPGTGSGHWLATLLDLDGDGDLDLVLAGIRTWTGQLVLQRFENTGSGNFTAVQSVTVNTSPRSLVSGDVDNDGDLDLAIENLLGQLEWLVNQGNGTLQYATSLPGVPLLGPVLGFGFTDLDGDGDDDLVGGRIGNGVPVLIHNGAGSFVSAAPLALTPNALLGPLDAGDVDGDGDADVVLFENAQLVWFRNNGSAGFVRMAAVPQSGQPALLTLRDLDGDGDLDVAAPGGSPSLYVNDGSGTFASGAALLSSPLRTRPARIDLDADGDLDLVAGTLASNSLPQFLINRERGAESTQRVQPGGAVSVRFLVRPQAPSAGALVLPLAALGPGPAVNIPGIAGRLLLPPGAVAGSLLGAGSGSAVLALPVPSLPSLIGTPISVQGVVLLGGTFAFTNVVDERVLP
ncbi:MAG: VCBS repeat-containing protein [Planctomycetes bacterium]|nr:VCBS repeat-containing protein [Planctomycetota bacterium]